MIVSFRDSDTEALADGKRVKRFVAFESVARRRLRINDQYRVCFVWTAAGPQHVEIVDYH
jgi:toxin HigB-1